MQNRPEVCNDVVARLQLACECYFRVLGFRFFVQMLSLVFHSWVRRRHLEN